MKLCSICGKDITGTHGFKCEKHKPKEARAKGGTMSQTFEEWVKENKIIRYVKDFERCWKAAQAAAPRMRMPENPCVSAVMRLVDGKIICDVDGEDCTGERDACKE